MFEDLKKFAKTVGKVFPYIWNLGWKYRVLAAGSVVCSLASVALKSVGPIFLGNAVGSMVAYNTNNNQTLAYNSTFNNVPQSGPSIYPSLILYIIFPFLGEIVGSLGRILIGDVSGQASRKIEMTVASHLYNVPVAFHTQKDTGIAARAFSSLLPAFDHFVTGSQDLIIGLLHVITVTGLVLGYAWEEGLILLGVIIGYTIVMLYASKRSHMALESQFIILRKTASKIQEDLYYHEFIRTLNYGPVELAEFDNLLTARAKAYLKLTITNQVGSSAGIVVMEVGYLAVVMLAGSMVVNSQFASISISNFITITTLVAFVLPTLPTLGSSGQAIINGTIGVTELLKYIDVPQEPSDKDFPDLNTHEGNIIFENVSFRYEGLNEYILKNVNFEIPKGKKTAIVGKTGQGKSTIIKLLLRFYEVTEGAIYIDGCKVNDYTRHSLRNLIGLVPQDTPMFNNTLYYNITYGNSNVSEEQFRKVLKESCLEEWINTLPDKEFTLVGERGLKISGGEKQRISIARALLRNPSIYIFDEATSSLDTKTEHFIQNVIDDITKCSTSLTIAHRLSTIKNADQIIVINDHTVVERGTHQSLLDAKGEYYKMWKQQYKKTVKHLDSAASFIDRLNHNILYGTLPHTQSLAAFEIGNINSFEGNDSAYAMLYTSREELIAKLMESSQEESVRLVVWDEIFEAATSNLIPHPEFKKFNNQNAESMYSTNVPNQNNLDCIEYCKSLEGYRLYIQSLNYGMKLGYKTALIFAKCMEIELYVWTRVAVGNKIALLAQNFSQKMIARIHILVNHGYWDLSILCYKDTPVAELSRMPTYDTGLIPLSNTTSHPENDETSPKDSKRSEISNRYTFFNAPETNDHYYDENISTEWNNSSLTF